MLENSAVAGLDRAPSCFALASLSPSTTFIAAIDSRAAPSVVAVDWIWLATNGYSSRSGYTSARKEIVDLLRQRSRPYLFSNSLPPPIVAASLKSIELLQASTELRDRLESNTKYFRGAMTEAGFNIVPGQHPITPIMLGDAVVAAKMAEKMLEKGVYVIGFSFPVVPQGKARIRTQVSAAHTREDLEFAVKAFTEVKREMGI